MQQRKKKDVLKTVMILPPSLTFTHHPENIVFSSNQTTNMVVHFLCVFFLILDTCETGTLHLCGLREQWSLHFQSIRETVPRNLEHLNYYVKHFTCTKKVVNSKRQFPTTLINSSCVTSLSAARVNNYGQ